MQLINSDGILFKPKSKQRFSPQDFSGGEDRAASVYFYLVVWFDIFHLLTGQNIAQTNKVPGCQQSDLRAEPKREP